MIASEGQGVLLYLRQEGRGIGLLNKLKAYALQDRGADTVEANERLGFAADPRSFEICGDMLAELGVRRVRLMTNNPRKLAALRDKGIDVVDRVPMEVPRNPHNQRYLATKVSKLGHLLAEGSSSNEP
jgi:GTP cyclohydrolase II